MSLGILVYLFDNFWMILYLPISCMYSRNIGVAVAQKMRRGGDLRPEKIIFPIVDS